METIGSSLAGSLQAVNSSLAKFFGLLTSAYNNVVSSYFRFPAVFIGFVYRENDRHHIGEHTDSECLDVLSRVQIITTSTQRDLLG